MEAGNRKGIFSNAPKGFHNWQSAFIEAKLREGESIKVYVLSAICNLHCRRRIAKGGNGNGFCVVENPQFAM